MHDVRKLSPKHYDEYVRITAEAYPGAKIVTAEDRAKARERIKKRVEDKRVTLYGAFRDDRLIGVMRLHDYVMNVRGAKVPTGGVGGVAVDLTHKREHVARDMMQFYLSHYYERDTPMAALWPFRPDFYRGMGFGLGGKMHQYRVKPESLPRGKSKEHVRYLTPNDIPALNAAYNRFFEQRNGMIQETELSWKTVFEFYENLRCVVCEKGGRIEGYLIYRFESDNPDNYVDNNLAVIELAYESAEVLSELLTFLHTQLDQINRVVISTPDDDFLYLLHDPRNDSGRLINPLYHQSHSSGVGIMYRVLDCRKLFGLFGDHGFGEGALRLRLDIRDAFFKENAGSIVVHFLGGRASAPNDGDYEVQVSLDVAEFSSLLMGSVRFRSLYDYGLAAISDADYGDQIDRLFATSQKPVCFTMF